jgi:hypothetical protein
VAGPAGPLRAVADGVETPPPIRPRRGTWDKVLTAVLADADAEDELDWTLSVDSTVVRVHQHGASAARQVSQPGWHTGNRRMTRTRPGAGTSRVITASAGPAAC